MWDLCEVEIYCWRSYDFKGESSVRCMIEVIGSLVLNWDEWKGDRSYVRCLYIFVRKIWVLGYKSFFKLIYW